MFFLIKIQNEIKIDEAEKKRQKKNTFNGFNTTLKLRCELTSACSDNYIFICLITNDVTCQGTSFIGIENKISF